MDLKDLKHIWGDSDFRPTKSLGQNFLVDRNVKDKIVSALSLTGEDMLVEIGSGFGMMSFSLAEKCGKLFAVEKDKRVCEIMRPFFEEKNINLLNADILDVDFSELTGKTEGIKIFGNIPYYISTPIIERIISQRDCIEDAYIVMQDDLANRIVSPPGSKVYGSISCFVQFYTIPEKIFKIKKNCFYPRPQVESCLLKLGIPKSPRVKVNDEDLMFKIIRKAFSERRKKILNPLSSKEFMSFSKSEWSMILEKCSIDPASRAEVLSLEDYARISDYVGDLSSR